MKLEPTLEQQISVQTGPDLQLLAFNSKGQQLRYTEKITQGKLGKPVDSVEKSIDVFSLKMMALLVCRGSLRQKRFCS